MTEQDMVEAAAAFLQGRDKRVAVSVPFMSQCIDLVFEEDCGELVAVEFKKHDWRRAIEQCRTHALATHRVYVCLPRREPSAKMEDLLSAMGVGLLLFDAAGPDVLVEHLPPGGRRAELAFPREWLRSAFEDRHLEGSER